MLAIAGEVPIIAQKNARRITLLETPNCPRNEFGRNAIRIFGHDGAFRVASSGCRSGHSVGGSETGKECKDGAGLHFCDCFVGGFKKCLVLK